MKKSVDNQLDSDKKLQYGKYILFGIIFLLLIISYQIVKPYLIVLISSFILAYLCKPIFNFLFKRINKNISAFACLIFIILIFIIPAALVVTNLSTQASGIIKNNDVVSAVSEINNIPFIENLNLNWSEIINKFGLFLFSIVGTVATQLPSMVLSGIVFLFSFFYILIEWEFIVKQIKKFIPFNDKERIVKEIDQSTRGIVFGYFLIAIIDFVVSAIGLYIAGINYYFLLSFLVAALVFLPGIGPSIVNLPLLVYLAFSNNWYAFAIVVATWAIISIGIETIFKSKLLGERAKIHPLIMIIGMLGGTAIFGIFGFIIGPLILVYTLKLIKEMSMNN